MGQGKLVLFDSSKNWPKKLQSIVSRTARDTETWQPILIEMNGEESEHALSDLLDRAHITNVVDNYDEQFAELIVSRRPGLYQSSYEDKVRILEGELAAHHDATHSWQKGSWVYYPWNGMLMHIVSRDLFLELRSTRNRSLITGEEQMILEKFNVGCAGMSVGSNGALVLGLSGYSQHIKLADGAVISGSNLNRVLANASDVGLSKSLIIARKLYEMNPYTTIHRIGSDITTENIDQFFDAPWPLHAIIDEIDDLKVKILLRIHARRRKIPVLMVTDLGDDVMLDVERFDLDPNLPLFHGLVDGVEELLEKDVEKREWLKQATTIIGPKNAPLRLQQAIAQIGHELATQPQLGGTAVMAGSVLAYAVRKIALGAELRSGRTIISLDSHLLESHDSDEYKRIHKESTEMLERALGII